MRVKEVIRYWLKSADEDWKSALALSERERYAHSLFFAHLTLEKTLKAYYVAKKGEHPPYTHSLLKLAELSGIHLVEEEKDFLMEVTRFNIRARYPEQKFQFYKRATKRFAEKYLGEIEEWLNWLKSEIV